jgi:indolepyruvate decarboxylase
MSNLSQNVGNYLIQRLYDHGVRHIFGVPGDFVRVCVDSMNN